MQRRLSARTLATLAASLLALPALAERPVNLVNRELLRTQGCSRLLVRLATSEACAPQERNA